MTWNFYREVHRDRLIAILDEYGCLSRHTFGTTYFIRLPNGNIKIGWAQTPEKLTHRIQELSRQHGGKVHMIAAVYGGESMEALMHHKYKDHKITSSLGEQFNPDPAMVEEINSLGMASSAIQALTILKKKTE